jgi:dienelactone hydrolase
MSRVAQERINGERGIVYGTVAGELLLLDVHRSCTLGEPLPAIVLIHGGGMWTGSRTHMASPARQLAQSGYAAFSVDYRLVEASTGPHRWPAQLDDVQLAVRWVRAHAADFGVEPARIGAFGWSAGGQLAALLGTRETRDATAPLASHSSCVACVVALAADVDLAAYTHPPELHEAVALLGGTYQEVPERYRDASPLSWIDERTVPFLIIHGDQSPPALRERMTGSEDLSPGSGSRHRRQIMVHARWSRPRRISARRSERTPRWRQPSSQERVRSTSHRCHPRRSLESIPRQAMRGVMPRPQSARRRDEASFALSARSLAGRLCGRPGFPRGPTRGGIALTSVST